MSAEEKAESRSNEFGRNWGVVLASLLGIGLGVAPLAATYTLGALVGPLSAEFGWSRASIMSVSLVMLVGMTPTAFAVGWIADRHGVRSVVVFSQVAFAACFAALGLFTSNIAIFYALYFAMAVLAAGTLPVTFARAISMRFDRQRGLALGMALAGTGLCGLLAPAFTALTAQEFGWRGAYLCLAVLPLLAIPAAWLLLPRKPQRTVAASQAKLADEPGLTVAQALKTPRFLFMAIAFFCVSGAITGALVSLVPLLISYKYPPVRAAEMAGVVGLAVIAGRLMVGVLIDKFWAPAIGAAFLVTPVLALVALAQGDIGFYASLGAFILIGLAVGAEVDLNAFLTSRYFGMRSFGRLYAIQYMAIGAGAAAAGPLFGYVYDVTNSYAMALLGAAGLLFVFGPSLLILGKYPDWKAASPSPR